MSEHNELFDEKDVIFRYTRKQAIEDGVLVDLTEWSREVGFVIPVACTHTVWEGYIVPPDGTRELGQSERGRAHDVLWMCHVAIRRSHHDREMRFEVLFVNRRQQHEQVTLKATCGPGDEGEPVLTIMRPDED